MIKDMLLKGVVTVSTRCKSFYKEMVEYKLNDTGVLKKENDHLIDAFRYILNLAGYSNLDEARPLTFEQRYKTGTPELDLLRKHKEEDVYGDIDDYLLNG